MPIKTCHSQYTDISTQKLINKINETFIKVTRLCVLYSVNMYIEH
jgi:hypothetical protein